MRTTPKLTLVLLLAVVVPLGCQSWRAARHYERGNEALDQGRVDSAISELEQARQLAPGRSEIENHLGLAYQAAGRREAALGAFDRAVALDCTNEAAKHNLAVAEAADAITRDIHAPAPEVSTDAR